MASGISVLLLISSLTSAVAKTCESGHVRSACLAGANYTSSGSCCIDSYENTAGCKPGYYKEIIARGCGGDAIKFSFLTLADKPQNLEVCCYEESSTGTIVSIVLGVVLVIAMILCAVACCLCDCCGNKSHVSPGAAPGTVVGQVVVQPAVAVQPVQQIAVLVPAGMVPGQQMSVKTPHGTDMIVTIPPGVSAGSTIQVACPPPQTFVVGAAIAA
eukprot:TRINITY_DN69014_c0_g1_i1.p1 TRINITY_DN69014_c0_g1~~TRINITY_DN69014_c0_g1_i1.p1  ORF type:complete len:215 (-),score=34.59 TRINITY_DN69014_c0_g1_i1:254-898(-)